MDFSGGSMLSGIMSSPQVPSDGLFLLCSSKEEFYLSISPSPRFCSSLWLFFHSEVVILFYPNSTQQDPELFIFLGVSWTEASELLLTVWMFWQPFLPVSLSQRFCALFSSTLPDTFPHQNLGCFEWVMQQNNSNQALQQLPLLSHSLLSPLTAVSKIFLLVISRRALTSLLEASSNPRVLGSRDEKGILFHTKFWFIEIL